LNGGNDQCVKQSAEPHSAPPNPRYFGICLRILCLRIKSMYSPKPFQVVSIRPSPTRLRTSVLAYPCRVGKGLWEPALLETICEASSGSTPDSRQLPGDAQHQRHETFPSSGPSRPAISGWVFSMAGARESLLACPCLTSDRATESCRGKHISQNIADSEVFERAHYSLCATGSCRGRLTCRRPSRRMSFACGETEYEQAKSQAGG
jgi:hypothetical protein